MYFDGKALLKEIDLHCFTQVFVVVIELKILTFDIFLFHCHMFKCNTVTEGCPFMTF